MRMARETPPVKRGWALVCCVLLIACGGGEDAGDDTTPDGLRVAAFDFAESEVLAELYAQAVEAEGVPVVRLGAVGPREIVAPALQLDRIDLVPEYVGTAAGYFGVDEPDLAGLSAALEPLGLVALEPASAQDVNVVVVTAATAREHDLLRISDLTELAPTASFGGPVECPERPLCLIGLRDAYGLEFAEFVPQRSVELTAEALRRGEIDVGLLFSTTPALSAGSLVVLDDDRGLQPSEQVVPVIRRDALQRWGPEVRRALDGVSAQLTTEGLRGLNRRVEEGEPVSAVATSWLAEAATTLD
jgi:osmoprotectant transport system substrate-binding protein